MNLLEAQRASITYPGPSLARRFLKVSMKPSFFTIVFSLEWELNVRTAWDVCTTQMGLEMTVVADPD